jgi:hypothetical protein
MNGWKTFNDHDDIFIFNLILISYNHQKRKNMFIILRSSKWWFYMSLDAIWYFIHRIVFWTRAKIDMSEWIRLLSLATIAENWIMISLLIIFFSESDHLDKSISLPIEWKLKLSSTINSITESHSEMRNIWFLDYSLYHNPNISFYCWLETKW